MSEWMNDLMNEWMNEWMAKGMYMWMNERVHTWIYEWTNQLMSAHTMFELIEHKLLPNIEITSIYIYTITLM